jgi:hypothetical protein
MKLSTTILGNIATTAALLIFIFVSLQVHHMRERRESEALYIAACQAYQREAALKDADSSQFYHQYIAADAAYQALDDFDVRLGWRDISRRDKNLEDCMTYPLVLRSPTSSQVNQGANGTTNSKMRD